MDTSRYPTLIMLLVALVQGFCLLILHESIEFGFWPATSPTALYSLYAFVLICPTLFLLAVNEHNIKRLTLGAVGFSLLCSSLAYYTGLQVIPLPFADVEDLLFPFCFSTALLTFKVLMYLQVWANKEAFAYPKLFSYSWRNLLTFGLALVFTLVTWGVLMLWAGLFKVINVDFFYELFTEEWFYYPILSMALAFGIILIRSLTFIVDTIKRLQQALLKYLLVLLVFISLLFLIALPFTGLAPIWENGPGSYLILWMQACILFALNSVYQNDAEERPYGLLLHRFIYLGILLLPCYSALVFYGLTARIDQYGWSLSRYWGMIVWALLALFALGYVAGIIRQRDAWISSLGKVNVSMGCVFMLVLIAINSPALDLRKLTVQDQVARLSSGDITLEEIDIQYFERHLAKPGYDVIQQWKSDYKTTNPNFVVRLNRLYMSNELLNSEDDKLLVLSNIECLNGCNAPTELLDQIYTDRSQNRWCLMNNKHMYLLEADPNEDGEMEYLLIQENINGFRSFYLYARVQQAWQSLTIQTLHPAENQPEVPLIESLGDLSIEYKTPKYKQMHIGEWTIDVSLRHNVKDDD
ncbi:protein of unknown function [Marisediminitalea aggregata]|uniref:DUF4153 domain-containing protein n=1 Tax=Marisediminitalea aggregata TaxID=634436 RepID=A0A1M5NNY7_9ALTE|nr:DUF4153 domain-containing protein [Marisediminitalea aggregata]SHG90643.1 protein of unknown function [Marisediminitalea aggregata]